MKHRFKYQLLREVFMVASVAFLGAGWGFILGDYQHLAETACWSALVFVIASEAYAKDEKA